MRLDGVRYHLKAFRFHSPSEHTINGAHTPMEMHLVHEDTLGNTAVIAVMIDEGSEHAAFKPMWDLLPPEPGQEVNMGEVRVNVQLLLPRSRRYYRYRGSLTTPPCTEGVAWLVMQDPIRLSKDQIDRYRSIYSRTNRPVQPLFDRKVLAGQ
jgi:carbonic anhydrase